MIFNSDYLKVRRAGLKLNVTESELADMAEQKGVRGVIGLLLKNGFAPTRVADSFAIASGGATMYRNRVNTYLKKGMNQKQSEKKAFEDYINSFVVLARETNDIELRKKIFKSCVFKPQQGGFKTLNDDYMCTNFSKLVELPFIKPIDMW